MMEKLSLDEINEGETEKTEDNKSGNNKFKNNKSGFVTLIGRPNVGKSTLMNRIIGQKIAITSDKPQTTRNRIRTVYTCERGQIVFVDTPGIHKAKNRLSRFMVSEAEGMMHEVDIILWLVEPSDYIGAGERHILEELKKTEEAKVFLLINKVDRVRKEEILKFIDAYRTEYDFAEIIPVSALKGDNVDVVVDMIFKYLPEGPMYYDEETVTDQPERQIVAELIREQALRQLSDEIPHGIAVTVEKMKFPKAGEGKRKVEIEASIICERESHKGIIIGKQGQSLKKIGAAARYSIEEMLERETMLKLWVKVNKNWRENDLLLKNFGYYQRDEE